MMLISFLLLLYVDLPPPSKTVFSKWELITHREPSCSDDRDDRDNLVVLGLVSLGLSPPDGIRLTQLNRCELSVCHHPEREIQLRVLHLRRNIWCSSNGIPLSLCDGTSYSAASCRNLITPAIRLDTLLQVLFINMKFM